MGDKLDDVLNHGDFKKKKRVNSRRKGNEDIFKPKSDLYKFIEQAKRDAERSKRDWLVIYKKTRHKPFVIVGKKYKLSHTVSINDKYYIYPLSDFLGLDVTHFLPQAS